MPQLIRIAEPPLLFRHEQAMIDPRDGLSLFGPLDKGKPYGIRWGVIGPTGAIERLAAGGGAIPLEALRLRCGRPTQRPQARTSPPTPTR